MLRDFFFSIGSMNAVGILLKKSLSIQIKQIKENSYSVHNGFIIIYQCEFGKSASEIFFHLFNHKSEI